MKVCEFPVKSKEHADKPFTDKQNKLQAGKFALVEFNKRIVFAPHCMRNVSMCCAIDKGGYYVCDQCGGCKINAISKLVKELGYKALYVVKGGRTIEKIVTEENPEAIVGIACFFEGDQAFKMLKDKKIVIQFVPLTKDGCTATDTDLAQVERVLKQTTKTVCE
ncbi:MAG: DUF116 domain-containing protein [Endomicrobium sp.]|jgi:hypothetical protein|nr:DUF116 domain-containing protein [Endomicrobium sp.]